jgi:site-specific DNA-methyltransferase (adenine-specific)
MNGIKIILGDCLEKMKDLQDKSVDLVLTDPPYGITKAKWDIAPSEELFNEIIRVSKKQIIFGGHFFNLPKKDGWIIWDKMPFLKTTNQCELLWTSFLKKNKIIQFRYAGNCVGNNKPDYKRPKVFFTSEKPIEFIELLIEQFSEKNDLIMDCFLGTGVTALACKKLNRKFIGIEKEIKHFEICSKRVGIL